MHHQLDERTARTGTTTTSDTARYVTIGAPEGQPQPAAEATSAEPPFTPGRYRVTFDRIGRDRPGPLICEATSGPRLADAVTDYAARYVLSSELCATVHFDGTGFLAVGGCRPAGSFRWELDGSEGR